MVPKLSHEIVYDCAFCHGEGERPKGSVCPVCRRKATVRVFRPPTVVCAFCKGQGEDEPGSVLPCGVCKGKGVISVREPVEACPSCDGAGRERTSKSVCDTCAGTGMIKKTEVDERFPPLWGQERECLEVILNQGRAGRATVGKKAGVSPDYAEYVCNTLAQKGFVKVSLNDSIGTIGKGQMFYPTPLARKAMNWKEKENAS